VRPNGIQKGRSGTEVGEWGFEENTQSRKGKSGEDFGGRRQ